MTLSYELTRRDTPLNGGMGMEIDDYDPSPEPEVDSEPPAIAQQIGEIITMFSVPYAADEPATTTVFRPAIDPHMANLPA